MVAWPSLTTHPTNPTSLKYTAATLRVQSLLASPHTTKEELIDALRLVRDTEMDEPVNSAGQRKKSPQQELEELFLILDGIYAAVPIPSHKLREALDKNGYRTVTCQNRLLDLNLWGPGDGDGNPNMDAKILEESVVQLKARIHKHYQTDLESIYFAPSTPPHFKETIEKFLQGKHKFSKSLLSGWLEHYPMVAELEDLYLRFNTFGNTYARIDVRHNAVDIIATIAAVLQFTDQIASVENFLSLDHTQQAQFLNAKLRDEEFIRNSIKINPIVLEKIGAGAGNTRILGRMRVLAKYPEMFGKLIIAETRTPADVLAALLLLKIGGCITSAKGATIDVVPLFESREDLVEAPFAIHELATEGLFAEHLRQRGYFLVMIAKSDTARLSGPGVQGQQEATYGKILTMEGKSYGGIQMFVMLGGGHDQMRGGGRIVESPHVILRAAAREGGRNPTKIAMTIQGQQMQLVFGGIPSAVHFIEAFCSQALLANARIQGLLKWRKVPPHLNERSAASQALDFFARAMDNYEKSIGYYTDGNPSDARRSLVEYFQGFPGVIGDMANKSSRPGSRTKTIDPLEGRAISLDQRSKHDGSYVTATIGVADALEYLLSMMRAGGLDELSTPPFSSMTAVRHCYLGNKSFRDFVRMQATVLHHKDYRNAWHLRGGVPTPEERQQLLKAYAGPKAYNPPRVFLAKLEERDHKEATILFHAISGKAIPMTISLKKPLEVGWPAVAQQMDQREEQSRFSKVIERHMAVKLQKPETTTDWVKRIAYYAYVGANPASTTPSFSMTMTDPYKEGKAVLDQSPTGLPPPAWVSQAKI